jgi:crotonobetainyl-CoA:carnitine CoA-transferase CaiB-like acyl-CoA transferase
LPSEPLSHFRVIDLTRARAGPTCVKQFADFGADVIKVESPADATDDQDIGSRDGFDMQNLHRNKRSMTLNLKTPEGREIFLGLAKKADVVVENYRPDVKQRLGCDYETLQAVNPRIILVSISGFGQQGPYRNRPGIDQIAQGMTGLTSVTGFPENPPVRTGAAITDVTAGLLATIGTMTALLEREVSGKGQWVQTSLLQAGIALMDFQAARYLIAGEVPGRVGNDHPTLVPMSAYKTSDGFINVGTFGTSMWVRLCEALGKPELTQRQEYATAAARVNNRGALNKELNQLFATRPSAHWIEAINKVGVPCGPIYRVDEVFGDEQIHLPLHASVTHRRLGSLKLVNQMVELSRTPPSISSAMPELGEHTEKILGELGYNAEAIARLREKRVV